MEQEQSKETGALFLLIGVLRWLSFVVQGAQIPAADDEASAFAVSTRFPMSYFQRISVLGPLKVNIARAEYQVRRSQVHSCHVAEWEYLTKFAHH